MSLSRIVTYSNLGKWSSFAVVIYFCMKISVHAFFFAKSVDKRKAFYAETVMLTCIKEMIFKNTFFSFKLQKGRGSLANTKRC